MSVVETSHEDRPRWSARPAAPGRRRDGAARSLYLVTAESTPSPDRAGARAPAPEERAGVPGSAWAKLGLGLTVWAFALYGVWSALP